MNIIIVGCGKVGATLAETLSAEKHAVSIIDSSAEALDRVRALDVSAFRGNGSSYRILLDAGVRDCDLLIAVTNRDEVNLLCCLFAKKAGVHRTIARVRDPDYYQEIDFIRDELGLSLTINPELACATYIYHLIRCPSAMELTSFAKGRVSMLTMVLPDDSPWDGKNLIEVSKESSSELLIAILEREGQALIPHGTTTLRAGDRVSLIVASERTNEVCQRAGIRTKPIKKVMIAGGSTTSYYLARRLLQARIQVTIIEYNRARCEELSDLLPKANIVCGSAADEELLLDEGLEKADAFVSLTNLDEENIMLSLYAHRLSDAKRITKVNMTNFNKVVSDIPVGSVVSPKHLTAETILHYARALRPSPDSDVEAVHRLSNDQVEALAFSLKESSAVTGVPLLQLPIRPGVLIGSIIRGRKMIIPSGQDTLEPGDFVIVVTTHKGIDTITRILE
ncbi:MAG: Trk system potassium transporter TrkA [Oscillospiraceae bacterium]|nr:Trk system potassium transporter TrkA [Oscillospiraceae bacterium]